MVNPVKSLSFNQVGMQKGKECHITDLPNDVFRVVFKIIANLKDFRQIPQISRFFKARASLLAPLEKAFGSSAQEIYATALAIKSRAAYSFQGHDLQGEVDLLRNSWNIADLKQLKKGSEARDAVCVWDDLQGFVVAPDVDVRANSLQELIEKRGEFSPWCKTNETELQQISSLDLHAQNLTSFPPECCEKLTGLRSLDLRENALISLPPEMGKLIQLTDLYLGGNAQLTSLPPELENLTNLQEVEWRLLDPKLTLSLIELGIINEWADSLLIDTWYGLGGGGHSGMIFESELLSRVEKIPVFSLLSGVARIVISISLIAFNALKVIVFGLTALGGLCLANKKIERVMHMAAIDSGWAIFVNIVDIARGIFSPIAPIFYFVLEHF